MKLQAAFDGDLHQCLSLLQKIHPYLDIAEIGTPLIYREGMSAVRQVRNQYPDLLILADLKIMDAGEEEAAIAFEAGSDIVTVLGLTQMTTLEGALNAARRFGKQIMVDMMQVNDLLPRTKMLLDLGCHYLCVHTAYDVHSTTHASPVGNLELLRRTFPNAPFAVAGGIGLNQLGDLVALKPEIIIIGGAITNAPDPVRVAQTIRERMDT